MTSKCKTCGHEKKAHSNGKGVCWNEPYWSCECEKFLAEDEIISKNKCSRCEKHNLSDEEASLCDVCDDELNAEEEAYGS